MHAPRAFNATPGHKAESFLQEAGFRRVYACKPAKARRICWQATRI